MLWKIKSGKHTSLSHPCLIYIEEDIYKYRRKRKDKRYFGNI
jgi:hypothetical protein